MESLGSYWWVPVVFAGFGAFLAGYFRRSNESPQHQYESHGSYVIDSSIGKDVTVELRRIAVAAEGIRDSMEKSAKAEDLKHIAETTFEHKMNELLEQIRKEAGSK